MRLSPSGSRRPVSGITLDPASSRDLDDAIWAEQQGDQTLVALSIADVSSEISRGSRLDQHAFQRVSTRYFAKGNAPMLPASLSEDTLSLREHQPRKTVTLWITFNRDMDVVDFRMERTLLTCQCRFTYEEADQALQAPQHKEHALLSLCSQISQRLLEQRRQNKTLSYFDPHSGWGVTEDGVLRLLQSSERTLSHQIIQELMILANTQVARFLAGQGIPLLYRNHTATPIAPSREVLLQEIAATLSHPEQLLSGRLWERLPLVMNRATYGPHLLGHYALNVPAYTHFTSPLRRYPISSIIGYSLPFWKGSLLPTRWKS